MSQVPLLVLVSLAVQDVLTMINSSLQTVAVVVVVKSALPTGHWSSDALLDETVARNRQIRIANRSYQRRTHSPHNTIALFCS